MIDMYVHTPARPGSLAKYALYYVSIIRTIARTKLGLQQGGAIPSPPSPSILTCCANKIKADSIIHYPHIRLHASCKFKLTIVWIHLTARRANRLRCL